MPETEQRAQLARDRGIRQIVFGAQDGVLTTLGIVNGVNAGVGNHATVILTGLVAVIVGAISMGVGEFLGGRTEREVLDRALQLEKREMLANPKEEFVEQVGYYRQKGFTREEAEMIVRRLEQNPDIWLHEMMRDEFGIDLREIESIGIRSSLVMAASFAGGGMFPILPYLLPLSSIATQVLGVILATLALFGIGFAAGRLGGRHPIVKGLEIVAAGALVYAVSYAVGHLMGVSNLGA